MDPKRRNRALVLILTMIALTFASTRAEADTDVCAGVLITVPFMDVSGNQFFCQIAAAYFSGLANGTSPTTYAPGSNVSRDQMAAFVTRTLDQSLKRGSQRAALRQFWTTQGADNLALTTVGTSPRLVESDGAHLWVANLVADTVSRIRASDGTLQTTYVGADAAFGVLPVIGKVFITGVTAPGSLYQIDPQTGLLTTLSSGLGDNPEGIAYDGQKIWTANLSGSVSIVSLPSGSDVTITAGFTMPIGILYDGVNIWVTDLGDGTIKKLNSSGVVIQTVTLESNPLFPAFDGTNIWVPNSGSNTVSVVRAVGGLAGTVIATLSGNGLNAPFQAAFDGERILLTNGADSDSVSLWKASDLTPIGTFSTGSNTDPYGVCSDGLSFWIVLEGASKLARF